MEHRRYNQYCATAKTLDIVGERWTLLITRELLTGPKRYTDLRESLPGIGTSLLAARLHHLQDAGVIRATTLPKPAGTAVYELTEAGRDLQPAIMAIAQWGLKWVLGDPEPDDVFRPGWAVLGMQAAYDREAAEGVADTYEFRVGTEVFFARVENGAVSSEYGHAVAPDVIFTADDDAFMDIASGRLTFAEAVKTKRIAAEGGAAAIKRCSRIFRRLPPERPIAV